jgi:metallo-beta-lactamase family protein
MATTLQFLGAAGTVTGSRYLVEHGNHRVLLDCGLFQGPRALRQRNWDRFPVEESSIDAVVLSHAHIDHTGYLPRLCRQGFRGPVYATPATRDLCAIMLPDSGRLHEEEAAYANKERYSKHNPALPLYTEEDAGHSLKRFQGLGYGKAREILPGITLSFTRAGHILGSASVQLDLAFADGHVHTLVFSGDLGRYGMPIIPDPEAVPRATTLLVESTYGNRSHKDHDPRSALRDEVNDVVKRSGALIIPAFAIGRTQDLLYHLRQLQLAGEIAKTIPIYVDSPMASDATPLYLQHREDHDDEMTRAIQQGDQPLRPNHVSFVRSRQESIKLNAQKGPLIIISASGMATGGRVLHHLAQRVSDPNTTILFVGYQAEGTRGQRLLKGEPTLRMFGRDLPVKARIARIDGFSAHADQDEVDRWLDTAPQPPTTTYCIHGEPDALSAQATRLRSRGWNTQVPAHLDKVTLD